MVHLNTTIIARELGGQPALSESRRLKTKGDNLNLQELNAKKINQITMLEGMKIKE
jgi:hypothetical protein